MSHSNSSHLIPIACLCEFTIFLIIVTAMWPEIRLRVDRPRNLCVSKKLYLYLYYDVKDIGCFDISIPMCHDLLSQFS